jgi:ribosome biogenesis protein MAK21
MGKLASNIVALTKFDHPELMSSTEKVEEFPDKKEVSGKRHRQNKSPLQAQSLELSLGNVRKEHIQKAAIGKKRDARGNLRKGKDDRALLLEEILALGGTEDDLNLIAGVTSDEDDTTEERTQSAITGGKFALELSQFVASLGIEGDFNAESATAGLEGNENSTGQDKPERNLFTDGLIQKSPTSTPREGRNAGGHPKALNHLVSMSIVAGQVTPS